MHKLFKTIELTETMKNGRNGYPMDFFVFLAFLTVLKPLCQSPGNR
ncbi:hypothetical protein SCOR_11915 [Sulfidibacter corallicola]